jgi:PAS domain-containing protein
MADRTREEARWAIAIKNATLGVWDLDPRHDVVHYSPQWKARLGFPRVEAADCTAFWRCRVHPDDVAPMLGSLRSHIDGCSPDYAMRFRLRSNGSGYRTMLSRGRVVARDTLGNATRMIGTMVDLTGRPATIANYGLATEEPRGADALSHLPFHALLGAAAPQGQRLVELIDDLLDVALREAHAAG